MGSCMRRRFPTVMMRYDDVRTRSSAAPLFVIADSKCKQSQGVAKKNRFECGLSMWRQLRHRRTSKFMYYAKIKLERADI
jgi:hypothetical protein